MNSIDRTTVGSVTNQPAAFESSAMMKEYGSNKDTLAPYLAGANSENWLKSCVCWIPRGVLSMISKVIYFLSCCLLCKGERFDTTSLEQVEARFKALNAVHDKWVNGSEEEKKMSLEPNLIVEIAEVLANEERTARLNHKPAKDDADARKQQAELAEFNTKHFERIKNEKIELLKAHDKNTLKAYCNYLDSLRD